MIEHKIYIEPVNGYNYFKVTYNDTVILKYSKQPFYSSARILLDKYKVDPNDVLAMYHKDKGEYALRMFIGKAAKWMLREDNRDGLIRVPYNPINIPQTYAGKSQD